jgi:hypothetical protein
MTPDLLHVVGYLTGTALYAMLLAMAVRDRVADRLTLGTAVLGLGWNVGELGVYALRAFDGGGGWLSAASFNALGFLAAVVVHAVGRGARGSHVPAARVARPLTAIAYSAAAVAGAMHRLAARPIRFAWASAAGRMAATWRRGRSRRPIASRPP